MRYFLFVLLFIFSTEYNELKKNNESSIDDPFVKERQAVSALIVTNI